MTVANLQTDNPYDSRENATCHCRLALSSSQKVEEALVEKHLKEQGYTYVEPENFQFLQGLGEPIYTRCFCVGVRDNTAYYCDFILFHPQKLPDMLIIDCHVHFHMDEFGMNPNDYRDEEEFDRDSEGFDEHTEEHDEDTPSVWGRGILELYPCPVILLPDGGWSTEYLRCFGLWEGKILDEYSLVDLAELVGFAGSHCVSKNLDEDPLAEDPFADLVPINEFEGDIGCENPSSDSTNGFQVRPGLSVLPGLNVTRVFGMSQFSTWATGGGI